MLKQGTTVDGYTGWRWDDGPIFLGADGRRLAKEYGVTVERCLELMKIARLRVKRTKEIEARKAATKKSVQKAVMFGVLYGGSPDRVVWPAGKHEVRDVSFLLIVLRKAVYGDIINFPSFAVYHRGRVLAKLICPEKDLIYTVLGEYV